MSNERLKIKAEVNGNNAVVSIVGNISDYKNNSEDFRTSIKSLLEQGVNNLELYINSGGGDCFQANEIANELNKFKGTKTATLGALCASAATYIASKCEVVKAASNTNYMIHKPYAATIGNSEELGSIIKLLQNLEAEYLNVYTKKTGLTVDKLKTMWATDFWMNSTEAKQLGFINEIEGAADVTEDEVQALQAFGYKNLPNIAATIKQQNFTNNKQNNMSQLTIVATALGLATDSAADVILQEVHNLKAAKLAAEKKQSEVETKLKNIETAEATALVDKAVSLGILPEALKANQIKMFTTDFENQKTVMVGLIADAETTHMQAAAQGKIKEIVVGSTAKVLNSSTDTFDYLQKHNVQKLKEIQAKNPELYAKLATDYANGIRHKEIK